MNAYEHKSFASMIRSPFNATEEDGLSDNSYSGPSEEPDTESGDMIDSDNEAQAKEDEPIIAKKETRDVWRLKLLVAIVLVASAIGVAFLVYFHTRNSELIRFHDQFQNDARKLMEEIGSGVEGTYGALDVMATMMVSYARASNSTWPNVTLPHFANRVSKLRSISVGMLLWSAIIVENDKRLEWEEYAFDNRGWVNETIKIMDTDENYFGPLIWNSSVSTEIYSDYGPVPYNETRKFAPMWQAYPTVPKYVPAYNWDWLSAEDTDPMYKVINDHKAILAPPYILPDPNNPDEVAVAEFWAGIFADYIDPHENSYEPVSEIMYPVIDEIDRVRIVDDNYDPSKNKVVAMIGASFYWRDILKNILPNGSRGIVIVVENPCSAPFTYLIDGPRSIFLGRGDHHESVFDDMAITSPFSNLDSFSIRDSRYTGAPFDSDYCPFNISAYPSSQMKGDYLSRNPINFAIVAVCIFIFTSIVFVCYDMKVERRQKLVLTSAKRSNAIVSSLFPSAVREQLYQNEVERNATANAFETVSSFRKNSIMHGSRHDENNLEDDNMDIIVSKPIAELYPETTVMIADIAGFTAWSSSRDPCQVFTLLETLYGSFDRTARALKVFKVETIGDSYVAVTGLPNPMRNHAVVMARFADDILLKTSQLTHKLEVTLGPDTSNLQLRIGLNSGPTTAGVLRGEKSRFQLFGDTINTASRMESKGIPGKIQCSQKTADLLKEAGKEQWLTMREDLIEAKGKGTMQTYWVLPTAGAYTVRSGSSAGLDIASQLDDGGARQQRLIEYNVDLFSRMLQEVDAARSNKGKSRAKGNINEAIKSSQFSLPVDEVSEVIDMPKYLPREQNPNANVDGINALAKSQLRNFISTLACMYKPNPFHNFEHACHVVMSTKKLLDSMVLPSVDEKCPSVGIDPLARFSILFGALIHDVDHDGVSNMQLIQEKSAVAQRYRNKCVAEQNSIDIAWGLLMQPEFTHLQSSIFSNDTELKRFRQLIVNVVLATDIFDKDLKSQRELRWETAFKEQPSVFAIEDIGNRKAVIFIEHLIQASDVVHTMQHWKVYQKWNHRLFNETYAAYKCGRSTKDPSIGWYDGELWFFDNYIIPLAKKLKVCGVFGANCDFLLDFACDNRLEWASKGREIVAGWLEEVQSNYYDGENDSVLLKIENRLQL